MSCERPSGPPVAPPSQDRIALVLPPPTHPASDDFAAAAQAFLADWSGALTVAQPREATVASLREAIAAATRRGSGPTGGPRADALCVWLPRGLPTAELLQAARESDPGLLITMSDERAAPPGVFGHVYIDWVGGAELLAESLPDALGDRRAYLTLADATQDELATNCVQRFRQRAAGFAAPVELDFERVAGPASDNTGDVHAETQPAAATERLFARYRHAALLAVPVPGAAAFVNEATAALPTGAGYVALDASRGRWEDLRSGRARAVVGPAYPDVVREALRLALRGLLGEQGSGLQAVVECELVTPTTADDFVQRYEALLAPTTTVSTTRPGE